MKPNVYIETTIISYLAARLSNNLIDAARQISTQYWWSTEKEQCHLFTSALVLREIERGDKAAAVRRFAFIEGIPELKIIPESVELAHLLLIHQALPPKANDDALHIAIAAVYGMDYIVTWNFRHIANASMRSRIEQVIMQSGYVPPIICTPDELIL